MTPKDMETMAYRARWAEQAVIELDNALNYLSYEEYERVQELVKNYPE